MKMRGTVFSGASRGEPLIEKYYARLVGLLGTKLFLGTLNVRMEKAFDIRPYARKTLEHVLPGGKKKMINAYIAEVKVRKVPRAYAIIDMRDGTEESIKRLEELRKTAKDANINVSDNKIDQGNNCWAIQFTGDIADKDVVEVVCKEKLRDELNLHDGDMVEVEFFEKAKK
jgi:CTP-dependent riboflavin kinase